jgi:hypothetical protein
LPVHICSHCLAAGLTGAGEAESVTKTVEDDSDQRAGPPEKSAASRVRESGEDFSASFEQLRGLVRTACEEEVEWQLKVIAGIRAMTGFVADHPGKAEALTIKARRGKAGRELERGLIGHFADALAEAAPSPQRLDVSTDRAIVEAIATIVRGHLLAGTPERLPDNTPDLVFLALMPYQGLSQSRRWVEQVASGMGGT